MPSFMAFVVATLFARIVEDSLHPATPAPLSFGLAVAVWVVAFGVTRGTLTKLRADLEV